VPTATFRAWSASGGVRQRPRACGRHPSSSSSSMRHQRRRCLWRCRTAPCCLHRHLAARLRALPQSRKHLQPQQQVRAPCQGLPTAPTSSPCRRS
jgi:hypothetical protein